MMRCPLSTYSHTAGVLPARCRNDRCCLARVAVPGSETSLTCGLGGSLLLHCPFLPALPCASAFIRSS